MFNIIDDSPADIWLAEKQATVKLPLLNTFNTKISSLLAGDDLNFEKNGKECRKVSVRLSGKTGLNVDNEELVQISYKEQMLRTIFDNMIKDEEQSSCPIFEDVTLAVLRKVLPNLIANDIIGMQPMTGPVSQIHTLRVRYNDENLNFSGTTGNVSESALNAAKGVLEGSTGQKLSIQILIEVIEAKTKPLQGIWNHEQINDPMVREEIIWALAQDIIAEIDNDILSFLHVLPGMPTQTFDMMQMPYLDGPEPTFVGEKMAYLSLMIIRQANLIGASTRRGAGNWCIVSPTALTILQSETSGAFARVGEGCFTPRTFPTGLHYVGKICESINVYVNQYASDDANVLIGYKGNDIDAPAFYCPFKPLIVDKSRSFIDDKTHIPTYAFKSKFGFLALTNAASSLGNAADYLNLVGIETQKLSFF